AVVVNADEAGIGGFVAVFVKARGVKNDVEALPLAGRTRGVAGRSGAFVAALFLFAGVIPTLINAAVVAVGEFAVGFAEVVEHLHFVAAHEVDAGVGAFAEQKLDVQFDVAKA